jgi:hypothetical protein
VPVMICVLEATLELHVNTFFGYRKLPTLGNLHRLLGLVTRVLLDVLDLLDNVVALEDLAEDNVLAIQPSEST